MKKIRMFLTAMTIVAFAYMTTSVFAEEMGKPMGTTHEDVSKWVGKEVKNTQGEDLGTVKDFVKDSEGRISFAVISYGGFMGIGEEKAAIPYSALTYNKDEQYFTCDISKDQLASAPKFENEAKLKDQSFAGEVYRHFGQRPYWTEESGAMNPAGHESTEGTGATKGMGNPYSY